MFGGVNRNKYLDINPLSSVVGAHAGEVVDQEGLGVRERDLESNRGKRLGVDRVTGTARPTFFI